MMIILCREERSETSYKRNQGTVEMVGIQGRTLLHVYKILFVDNCLQDTYLVNSCLYSKRICIIS